MSTPAGRWLPHRRFAPRCPAPANSAGVRSADISAIKKLYLAEYFTSQFQLSANRSALLTCFSCDCFGEVLAANRLNKKRPGISRESPVLLSFHDNIRWSIGRELYRMQSLKTQVRTLFKMAWTCVLALICQHR